MIEPRNIIDEENEDVNEFIGNGSGEFDDVYTGDDQNNTEFDNYSSAVSDIDFSDIRGDFKKSFHKVNKKVAHKQAVKKKPLTKMVDVHKRATITGGKKKIARVIVPSDRKVIVEGVSKFILSNKQEDESLRNIGYYKGKKLKKLILTIDNTSSGVDFNVDLFNPSFPLDYVFNTSEMVNSKITIGGPNSEVAYTDMLFNILANPTMIMHCKFVFTGSSVPTQMTQNLTVKNKSITGEVKIDPVNYNLEIDPYQYQSNIVSFDIFKNLNRPFVVDGMDIATYKVLAGNSATLCFYYRQKSLKRYFFAECRTDKRTLR